MFFREHIEYWRPKNGFNLSAQSDSPMGGGLGGSSSLSVSIFRAFCQLNEIEMDDYEVFVFARELKLKF